MEVNRFRDTTRGSNRAVVKLTASLVRPYWISAAPICGVMGAVADSGLMESVTFPFMLTVLATIITCSLEAFPEKVNPFFGK